jgi:hypothetical protein
MQRFIRRAMAVVTSCVMLTPTGGSAQTRAVSSRAAQKVPATGVQLLATMHDRYRGVWFNTLQFTQKTTTYAAGGKTDVSMWYESVRQSDAGTVQLRIDTGDPAAGNGVLYTADSLWAFRGGKQVVARAGGNTILPLIHSVYVQPVERTIAELRSTGVDLARAVLQKSWNGSPVWVAGAASVNDSTSPQFWIDPTTQMLVRAIFSPAPSTPIMDMRFEAFVELAGGRLATRCTFYVAGAILQLEEYQDWKANVTFAPGLFEAPTWTSAKHWATPIRPPDAR